MTKLVFDGLGKNGFVQPVVNLTYYGYFIAGSYSNHTQKYDKENTSWLNKVNYPYSSSFVSSASVKSKSYSFSGHESSTTIGQDKKFEYDYNNNTYNSLTDMIDMSYANSKTYNLKVYLYIGSNNLEYVNTTDTMNTKTGSASLNNNFGSGLYTDTIYTWGGLGTTSLSLEYDITDDSWSNGTTLPTSLAYNTGQNINNLLYSWACHNGTVQAFNYQLNPVSSSWTQKTNMLYSTNSMGSFVIDELGFIGGGNGTLTNSSYYTDTSDSWTTNTSLNYGARDVFGHSVGE